MLKLEITNRFKKDYKRMEKRGSNVDEIWSVVGMILTGKKLPNKYRDHQLTGNFVGSRDCHIQPDWILIYTVNENVLTLERTGSHSDLF